MWDVNQKYWDPKIELMSPAELRILQERRLRQAVKMPVSGLHIIKRNLTKQGSGQRTW